MCYFELVDLIKWRSKLNMFHRNHYFLGRVAPTEQDCIIDYFLQIGSP
jgi:hypothetical protein